MAAGLWKPQLNLHDGPTRQIVQTLQTFIENNHPITICTSTTRPANPQTGWFIYETDAATADVALKYWSGAAWTVYKPSTATLADAASVPKTVTATFKPTAASQVIPGANVWGDFFAVAQGGPVTATIVKARADTKLVVEVGVDFSHNVTSLAYLFGINLNAADTEICRMWRADAINSDHRYVGGVLTYTGLAAGSWSPKLRCQTSNALAGPTSDTNDRLFIKVTETF